MPFYFNVFGEKTNRKFHRNDVVSKCMDVKKIIILSIVRDRV